MTQFHTPNWDQIEGGNPAEDEAVVSGDKHRHHSKVALRVNHVDIVKTGTGQNGPWILHSVKSLGLEDSPGRPLEYTTFDVRIVEAIEEAIRTMGGQVLLLFRAWNNVRTYISNSGEDREAYQRSIVRFDGYVQRGEESVTEITKEEGTARQSFGPDFYGITLAGAGTERRQQRRGRRAEAAEPEAEEPARRFMSTDPAEAIDDSDNPDPAGQAPNSVAEAEAIQAEQQEARNRTRRGRRGAATAQPEDKPEAVVNDETVQAKILDIIRAKGDEDAISIEVLDAELLEWANDLGRTKDIFPYKDSEKIAALGFVVDKDEDGEFVALPE